MARSTLARVFPDRIRHNAARVRSCAPQARILACVKANGYGHGTLNAAEALADCVDGYAVASLEEALVLRQGGIEAPVVLLEGPHSAAELAEAKRRSLTACICDWHQLEWLEELKPGTRPDCWLKIDTGMHRLGVHTNDAAQAYMRIRQCLPDLAPPVLATHFARADELCSDATDAQLHRFDKAVRHLEGQHSCANSGAILRVPGSHRQWVRPGYMLYGGSPFKDISAATLDLQPAMEFSAEIISLRTVSAGQAVGYGGRWVATRDSQIATIAAGYGDGYPRLAPDGTPVLVRGQRAPLAGRVSMDMITVDVTDLPDTRVGDRAILWGTDPDIDEIAALAGTIGYELLAGMPQRVPRTVQYAENDRRSAETSAVPARVGNP